MLIVFTLVVMGIIAYYHWHEGLFNAACLLACVFLSGLFAFNFFEPLAGLIESMIDRSALQGYEDFLSLVILFCVALGLLRAATNAINNKEIEFQPVLNQVGAGFIALITGYLLSGFLICAMETLPWSQHFLGFEPYQETEMKTRSLVPPDRLWLALMHRAGIAALSRGEGSRTFDPEGAFESNYLYNRRHADAPAEGKQ
jgi:hypothetical protein